MQHIKILLIMTGSLFIAIACSSQNNGLEDLKKGRSAFQLANGSSISTDAYDEYSPVLVRTSDEHLALIYASNAPCAGCSGHNIFIAKSTSTWGAGANGPDGLTPLPTFNTPVRVAVGGSPLNATDKIHLRATANGSGVRIFYYSVSLGSQLNYLDISDVSSPSGSSSQIPNSAFTSFVVGGINSNGSELMAYDEGSGEAYVFNPMGTGDTPSPVPEMFGGFGALYVPQPASGVPDSWLVDFGGVLFAGSPGAFATPVIDLQLSMDEAGIFMTDAAGFYGGNDSSDIITFSALDYDTFSEDLYAITSHTIGDIWNLADFFFDFEGLPELVIGDHYYPFDGDWDDFGLLGGWNGSATGISALHDSGTVFIGSESAAFTGDGYLDLGSVSLGNQFTIAFWVYLSGSESDKTVISHMDGSLQNGFNIQIDNVSTDPLLLVNSVSGGIPGTITTSGLTSVDTGQWNHFVISVDADIPSAFIYVNGTPELSVSGSLEAGFPTSGYNLLIGANPTGANNFEDNIDDLHIFEYILSPAEVAQLYAQ
ncbi:MAG: LamG domain-containing protein [Leptospiraceae bacterium]|nr:LamG domain-containing protein [Leptospiraceae bacterium]